MIQLQEYNPWADAIGQFGSGFQKGFQQERDYQHELGLQEAKKQRKETESKSMMAENALATLNSLEGLVKEPGIGFLGSLNPSPAARRNRGDFESTTAALLPMFKAMFPRGFTEREFKIIRQDYIPQAGDNEEKIMGKIKGLKHLIGSLSEGKSWSEALGGSKEEDEESKIKKERFDPANPEHQAKARQLHKKFGDKEKVRKKLRTEFEGI